MTTISSLLYGIAEWAMILGFAMLITDIVLDHLDSFLGSDAEDDDTEK